MDLYVTYRSAGDLSCASCLPANVTLWLTEGIVSPPICFGETPQSYGYQTLSVQITAVSQVGKFFDYTIKYSSTDILLAQIDPSDILGICCESACTQLSRDVAGSETFFTNNDDGTITFTSQHGCEYTFAVGGDVSGLVVVDTQTVDLTLTNLGLTSQLTADVKISNGTGNVIVAHADGLYATTGWSLTGNTGTVPGTNFIGTNDNVSFDVRVNNDRVRRSTPNTNGPFILDGYSGNVITSTSPGSTIGGGGGPAAGINSILGNNSYSTISGGSRNTIAASAGQGCTISGGQINQIAASSQNSTIGGGTGHTVTGNYGSIGGGNTNTVTGVGNTISGGQNNTVLGTYGFIGGGQTNSFSGTSNFALICGGNGNSLSGSFGVVVGGQSNTITTAAYGIIGGGFGNTITGVGPFSVIGGGEQNTLTTSAQATIGGGLQNGITSSPSGGIAAGTMNSVFSSDNSFIGGGTSSSIFGASISAAILGGDTNIISGASSYAVITGGNQNLIEHASTYAGILSGQFGDVNASTYSVIGGGLSNSIGTSTYSDIAGGRSNTISGSGTSVIGGGWGNIITNSTGSAILGGFGNTIIASSIGSVIVGGASLKVGSYSFGFQSPVTRAAGGSGNYTPSQIDVSAFPSIAYFGDTDVIIGNTNNTARTLYLWEANVNASYAGTFAFGQVAGPGLAQHNIIQWPAAVPTPGQVLTVLGTSNVTVLGVASKLIQLVWA